MANSDFFSNMMGFSAKYTEAAKSQVNDDDTDYDAVDFCQGEDVDNEKFSLFGENDSVNDYSSNDCLFNFDAEIDEGLG